MDALGLEKKIELNPILMTMYSTFLIYPINVFIDPDQGKYGILHPGINANALKCAAKMQRNDFSNSCTWSITLALRLLPFVDITWNASERTECQVYLGSDTF